MSQVTRMLRIRLWLAYATLAGAAIVPMLGYFLYDLHVFPHWDMFVWPTPICKVHSVERPVGMGWEVVALRELYPVGSDRQPRRLIYPWTQDVELKRWYCAKGWTSFRVFMSCSNDHGWTDKTIEAKCKEP